MVEATTARPTVGDVVTELQELVEQHAARKHHTLTKVSFDHLEDEIRAVMRRYWCRLNEGER